MSDNVGIDIDDKAFEKWVGRYKRELRSLYQEKELWEAAMNNTKDVPTCQKHLNFINMKIVFINKSLMVNDIDMVIMTM